MNLQQIYTTLTVTDLVQAEDWYSRLLGRGPDYRPMDSLVQWDLIPGGGLQLSTDEMLGEGQGAIFMVVAEVAAERRRLSGLGIVLEDNVEGTYSTLAQVRDADGNLITLGTPPSPEYPRA